METITTGPLGRDKKRFMELLDAVRNSAKDEGRWKLVSVSLAADRFIDPLAVIESIHETGQRHFYMESPDSGEALAGAESAVDAEFSGADRFEKARNFAREVYDNAIAVGQLDLPLAGPKIFCAFTFESDDDPKGAFRPATLFVPRWQVSAFEGAYVATANLFVTSDCDIEKEAGRILAAHEKYTSFDYSRLGPESEFAVPLTDDGKSDASYVAEVDEALREIRAGASSKIVVARRRTIISPRAFNPFGTLSRIRDRYPSCRAFSIAAKDGTTFIGASPETLAVIKNGILCTEALAGTTMRGGSPAEDAKYASELLSSEKEMREHHAVAETIHGQLAALGLDSGPMPRPRIARLPNAQHIRTPFSARVNDNLHILDVVHALHPTPATSGLPQNTALEAIRRIEKIPRGLYSGVVGYFNEKGEGEMAVALRSGLIKGCEAVLYAGAGVVEGSEPSRELVETRLKMSALASLIG
jgi:menaquinone-specific isochorismate synthase